MSADLRHNSFGAEPSNWRPRRPSLAGSRARFFAVRSQAAIDPSTASNVELTLTGSRLLINRKRLGSR